MKLTDTDRDILQYGADGICIRGVWKWSRSGEWVTRQVNKLIKHGLLKATYFSNGRASTYITHAGRLALSDGD